METDLFIFCIIEGLLILLFIIAFVNDIRIRCKEKTSIKCQVIRGQESMYALYVSFGASTFVSSLIIQVCEDIIGNKIFFIIINYFFLIYLYFFSSWFRNRLFFRLINRIKRD